jgi:PIN domain nuclease of toxin-antitoxin system
MRVLLDTHLLLWSLAQPERLPKAARTLIEESDVVVSAASIWEISIKASLGKLDAEPGRVLAAVEPAGFSLLGISGEHAAAVFGLAGHHRDPFDRLLVVQAQLEAMTLLTNDSALAAYGACVHLV